MRFCNISFVISVSYLLLGLGGCEMFSDEGGDGTSMDDTSTWITMQGARYEMGKAHLVAAGPVHTVNVPTFDITRTEVTVAQYAQCVNSGFCSPPASDHDGCNWGLAGFEQHPVNCVTWYQASQFCEWFGGRLLTEAEWEFAARSGGDSRDFPWGMDKPSCAFAVMTDAAGVSGCGNGRTWPVCSKPEGRTDQGLCDMAGNVYEWVEDNFHHTYDGTPPTDGSAWLDPDATVAGFRVLRGAAYNAASADYLHVAGRANEPGTVEGDKYGIRCGRTPL